MEKIIKSFRSTLYIFSAFILWGCDDDHISQEPPISIEFELLGTLDSRLEESSGITCIEGSLYSHNDSGNTPSLFELNTRGQILNQIDYNNLVNTDWEAITSDDNYVYIGDFGNNNGMRQDLNIIKFEKTNLLDPNLNPTRLYFRIPDQTDFSIQPFNTAYDIEAFISRGQYLYFFTKNWIDQNTVVYQINKSDAQQVAIKIATIDTMGLVTDAAIDASDRILLVGYDLNLKPFIALVLFDEGNFDLQERKDLPPGVAQIEAATLYATEEMSHTFIITSEKIALSVSGVNSIAQIYKLQVNW